MELKFDPGFRVIKGLVKWMNQIIDFILPKERETCRSQFGR